MKLNIELHAEHLPVSERRSVEGMGGGGEGGVIETWQFWVSEPFGYGIMGHYFYQTCREFTPNKSGIEQTQTILLDFSIRLEF